jgi:hypothetical protein
LPRPFLGVLVSALTFCSESPAFKQHRTVVQSWGAENYIVW